MTISHEMFTLIYITAIFLGMIFGTLVAYFLLNKLIKTDIKNYIDSHLNYFTKHINENMRILEEILDSYYNSPGEEWKKRRKPKITDEDLKNFLDDEENT